LATLKGDVHGDHWHTLRQLLPLYQAITSVDIGNGKSTSFWDDVWLGDEALADRYPLVLSHCNFKSATVSEIIGHGIENYMVPRVSPSAMVELRHLSEELHQVNLTNLPDKRQSMFCKQESKLDSGALYKMLKARGQPSSSDSATFIWKSFAPPRVQMFMWLLSQNRLQSRSLLTLKKIVSDPTCEVCGLHEETQSHIFYHCDMAAQFWSRMAMNVPSDPTNLLSWNRPASVAQEGFSSFVALCHWQLWKARNEKVFRQCTTGVQQLLRQCSAVSVQWEARLPPSKRHVVRAWEQLFEAARQGEG
jgi:hypothetical protein